MIYFVRHGATDWNDNKNEKGEKDPKCQGRADLPLNEKGVSQALATAQTLKNVKFDRVLCSPLTRTVQTCELILGSLDGVEFDDRLLEREFGEYEGFARSEFDFMGFWNSKSNQQYERAETIADVEARVFSLLKELEQEPEKNVLIVSHGGVGCLLLSYFDGKPKDGNYLSFEIPNGKPLIRSFNTKVFE